MSGIEAKRAGDFRSAYVHICSFSYGFGSGITYIGHHSSFVEFMGAYKLT